VAERSEVGGDVMEINEFDYFSMQSPQSFAFGKIQLPLLRGAFQIVKF